MTDRPTEPYTWPEVDRRRAERRTDPLIRRAVQFVEAGPDRRAVVNTDERSMALIFGARRCPRCSFPLD